MNLKNISNEELIFRIEKLVRTERKMIHHILLHINEVERRKLYADLGFSNMYAYLTKGLGYSNGSAFRRLESARLLADVPAVAEKIESGALNLTQLTDVQRSLKTKKEQTGEDLSLDTKYAILENIEKKNTFDTTQILVKEFDLPIQQREFTRPQKDDSVRLEITLTAEQYAELQMAKDLLSHVCPSGAWSDVIEVLAKKFNTRKMQPEKTKRADELRKHNSSERGVLAAKSKRNLTPKQIARAEAKFNQVDALQEEIKSQNNNHSAKNIEKKPRKYISVFTKRNVYHRANGCCEYIDPRTQQKCSSSFQGQIEHVKPWAWGGSDSIDNLQYLCRTHNLLMARSMGLGGR